MSTQKNDKKSRSSHKIKEKIKPQKKPVPQNTAKKKTTKKLSRKASTEIKILTTSGRYLIGWCALMVCITMINLYQVYESFQRAAIREAEVISLREDSFRSWFYQMDEIYAALPHTAAHLIEGKNISSITSTDGNVLTKINPQIFTKALNETSLREEIKTRIISFDNNISSIRPDQWESNALHSFIRNNNSSTSGTVEPVYDTFDTDNGSVFRYIKPLYITDGHFSSPNLKKYYEDYSIGEIYGAVSISFSLDKIRQSAVISYLGCFLTHFIIWLSGTIMLYIYTQQALKYFKIAKEAETRLQSTENTNVEQAKQNEVELEQLRERAKLLREYKSSFLSAISHEVRTPLNGIIGMTELMLRTKVDDSQASMLGSIKSSGNALLTVINDIWDYAKIEANQIELEKQPFPLRDTVFDVVKSLAPKAYAKNLEVNVNISLQAPDILVGDTLRLHQVLYNIIDNAIKFTDSGEIGIDVFEKSVRDSNVSLEFVIKDTGIGIPLDKQKLIFEELEQEDHSNTRKYSGVGLGLTISHRIVSLMGGSVKLHSEAGVGSTFTFTIEFPYLANYAQDSDSVSADRLKNIEVLVVDDNLTNRKILTEQLTDWGMVATECSNVDDAMKILTLASKSITPISIIISDLQMPGKDGIDLAFATKNNTHLAHIPVIILSSGTITTKIPHSLIFSYLTKPTRLSELLKVLVRAVDSIDEPDIKPDYIPSIEDMANKKPGLSVLLVEDLEINQLVTTRMLEMLGHSVVIAQNGQQAIDILTREAFDIVLMDIKMPIMDGLDAVRIIRKREIENSLTKRMPVIALTANAHKKEKELYLSEGMDAYLLKPVTIHELTETINEVAKRFNIHPAQKDTSKQAVEVEELSAIDKTAAPTVILGAEPCNTFPRLTSKPDEANVSTKQTLFSAEPTIDPSLMKKSMNITKPNSSSNQPSIAINPPTQATDKASIEATTATQTNAANTPNTTDTPATPIANSGPSIATASTTKPSIANSGPSIANSGPSITKPSIANSGPSIANSGPSITKPSIANSGPSIANSGPSVAKPSIANSGPSIAKPSIASSDPSIAKPSTKKIEAKATQAEKPKSSKKERTVTPPLDAEQIKRSFSAFPDLAIRSMTVFIKDYLGLMHEMTEALKQQDNSSLKVNAHAIKGLVSYYTKGDIYELALTLENMGRDEFLPNQADEVQKTLFMLEEEMEAIVKAMQIYLNDE